MKMEVRNFHLASKIFECHNTFTFSVQKYFFLKVMITDCC